MMKLTKPQRCKLQRREMMNAECGMMNDEWAPPWQVLRNAPAVMSRRQGRLLRISPVCRVNGQDRVRLMQPWGKSFGCCVMVLPLLLGCDRIYKTHQAINLQVVHASDGEAIRGAHVDAAQKYYQEWRASEPDDIRNEKWIDRYGQRSTPTDSYGRAVIDMKLVSIRGGLLPYLFPWFDYKKDRVSGKCYLLRVRSDSRAEILAGKMSPNNFIAGDSFTIRVLSIGDASADK